MNDSRQTAPSLSGLRRIKPAADEDRDPIDVSSFIDSVSHKGEPAVVQERPKPVQRVEQKPVSDKPATVRKKHGRSGEPVVQLNSKISLRSRQLLDDITERDGVGIREAVELAIEEYSRGGKRE